MRLKGDYYACHELQMMCGRYVRLSRSIVREFMFKHKFVMTEIAKVKSTMCHLKNAKTQFDMIVIELRYQNANRNFVFKRKKPFFTSGVNP